MAGKSRKRILVIDDEPDIRNICRRALTLAGFEVETAANGEEARQLVGRNGYDLYVVDIRMPVLNGAEFYRWLESEQPQKAQRVIFMTGSSADDETGRFLQTSGRAFLLKPFSISELEQAVRKNLKETTG